MELIEIRDLDGPNLFALVPVIKLEIRVDPGEHLPVGRQQYIAEHTNHYVSAEPAQALCAAVHALHQLLKIPSVHPEIHWMDAPGHVSVCYEWHHRGTARGIAHTAFELLAGERFDQLSARLTEWISQETDEDEPQEPTWVRDTERRVPSASITGTNGKTTTTRLLAHVLSQAGNRVGWSSSSGVYIEGEMVIEGDYTGHGGARRVLTDPVVDCAVLETARGGILLRGLGYESSDVGVFLNVSEDHLNLHGVLTIETLARAKSTVIRATNPNGLAVLNADDPIVLAQMPDARAEVALISQHPENQVVRQHLESGGRAVLLEEGVIVFRRGQVSEPLISVAEVPLTYGGLAPHMVENALAACAAAIGMGTDPKTIGDALRTFHPDRDHNAGRLNVFELDDFLFIVDFAHNESGLKFLLEFTRQLMPEASRLTAIVGTAGDRQESVFVGLGRIAGERADRVLIKSNPGYLRGKTVEQTDALITEGLCDAGGQEKLGGIYRSELEAAIGAMDSAQPGEVIVVMCVEDYREIFDELGRRGARERTPEGV